PQSYGYCLHACTRPLREAVVRWFARRYGEPPLDPDLHVLPLIGSQEGMAHLLLAIADPGDTVLMPDPAYPSYFGAAALAGVRRVALPLLAERGFLPDLEAVAPADAEAARALVLSYPNNPTAGVADAAFFDAAVDFARRHDLLLIHDFPYVDTVFGDYRAPSLLARPGGLELGIELYSCSKSFHLAGLRMGWAVGHPDAIAALARVKGAVDFNQYLGAQRAAIAALEQPPERLRADAERFRARRDALVTALNGVGWETPSPQASMYVWTRLPAGRTDSFAFCLELVREAGVALAPGRAFGERGEGYVRFALVQEPEALRLAVDRIRRWLD
ncbi:MAG: aminotransferase class I/II-fold pyridoxal phosphate-dependent enzyme, partial [Deinococcales bacterium]